jgi:sRNA-binding carbon storage regulator CsrA
MHEMEVLNMLVLTRKCQEVVVAARDVPVHRLEVWEQMRARTQVNGPTERPSG